MKADKMTIEKRLENMRSISRVSRTFLIMLAFMGMIAFSGISGTDVYAASKLTVKPTAKTLEIGKATTLKANKSVKWTVVSGKANVKLYSKKSKLVKVKTLKSGKATVKAKALKGGKYKLVKVTVKANKQQSKVSKKKKEYGVFLSIDASEMKKLYGYKEVVIDAQYFSKRDIQALHKKGVKVYTYLNVGSIENFRKYYKDYEHLAIGDYENWDEEKWVDVSSLEWQKFIKGLSGKLLKKGVDGFFIDNCDVYDYANTKENFVGLVKILRNIKSLKKEVIINGGDVFVKKYKSQYGSMKSIMTAVNQETVWSRIIFNKGTFGKQPKDVHNYFSNYVKLCKKDGMRVYLLEYTKDKKLITRIKKYCNDNKFKYYISDSIELD